MTKSRKRTRKGVEVNPVRLCCGERHRGAMCNDGKVMCCLCFNRVDYHDLSDLKDGTGKEDVCQPCADDEDARKHARAQALYELREKAQQAVDSGAVKRVTIESGTTEEEPRLPK